MNKMIPNELRTVSEIAEELRRKGYVLEVSADRSNYTLIPPPGADQAEIDAAGRFFLEVIRRAADEAGVTGKWTIK